MAMNALAKTAFTKTLTMHFVQLVILNGKIIIIKILKV